MPPRQPWDPPINVIMRQQGMSSLQLEQVDIEEARIPGVGVGYTIHGIVSDEQLARAGVRDRTIGLPTEFRNIQAGQRGGRSIQMVGWDLASSFITDEELEGFIRTPIDTKKVEVKPPEPTDRETMIITED